MKQRLIGAVVLIALGVIFIPMILDGAGRRERVTLDMEIPPEPLYEPVTLPPLPEPPTRDAEGQGEPAAEPAAETAEPTSAPEARGTRPAPERTAVMRPVEPAEPPSIASPSTGTHATTPATPPATPALESWDVQVGSFGDQSNALALRDKLRTSGYAAFVENFKADDGKTVYRVKVGPVLARDAAEKLRGQLLKSHQLEGLIVAHP